jgi:hypothetical protein
MKIQTEGREMKEVIRVGNVVRIDLGYKERLRDVLELRGFQFEATKGHELANGTRVYYVTITGVMEVKEQPKQVKKASSSKKRYVIKNAIELGIESGYVDDRTGKWVPTWYVWDKKENDLVEGIMYEGEGAKAMAKRDADFYNTQNA